MICGGAIFFFEGSGLAALRISRLHAATTTCAVLFKLIEIWVAVFVPRLAARLARAVGIELAGKAAGPA
jgi:hypothetical protein